VEVEGKISQQYISILIELGCNHDYIACHVVDLCVLQKLKHKKSWLVQLDIGTKRKVSELVEACPLQMNGISTWEKLNVFLVGLFEVLIDMDWLEAHKVKLDFYNITFDWKYEDGNPRIIKGTAKSISIRQISALQLKKIFKKGFQCYVVHVLELAQRKGQKLEDYPILQEFNDVFLDEIPNLHPKRDIEFSIDLILGATSISKVPYVSSPKAIEIKMQFQELLE